MQKQLYTKNMVYGMTYRGDCVGTKNSVPLHSEIRDVHRLAADVDYFFRARMLSHVALRNKNKQTTASPPALSRREGAGRQQRNINENEQNYGQYKANANARILLLPGYDDGNEVRDCTYIV